jgi:hypothetical protein
MVTWEKVVKLMDWNSLFLDSVPRVCAMTVGGKLCWDWINTPLHEFDGVD